MYQLIRKPIRFVLNDYVEINVSLKKCEGQSQEWTLNSGRVSTVTFKLPLQHLKESSKIRILMLTSKEPTQRH